jgi:hypothetical protein
MVHKIKDKDVLADFTIVALADGSTGLVIHGGHVVALSKKDSYDKLFDASVKKLGGRKDKAWVEKQWNIEAIGRG